MKKIFLLVAFAAVAFGADASMMFTSWCGKVCQTVDESYFEDPADWESYKRELNKIMCGSEENPNIDTEDHDTSSDVQP